MDNRKLVSLSPLIPSPEGMETECCLKPRKRLLVFLSRRLPFRNQLWNVSSKSLLGYIHLGHNIHLIFTIPSNYCFYPSVSLLLLVLSTPSPSPPLRAIAIRGCLDGALCTHPKH